MLKILNASPGIGAPLNEQETVDFLTTGKLNIHLGTVDEKGDANVHPAWYYYDPGNNRIYVETSKQGKKTSNIRRKGNVYFCIDDPNPPYKGARGKGSVKVHEDINFNVPIAEKLMVKYLGSIEHPMAQALLNMQKGGQSVILEINPKYYSTWDYSRQ
ncbi:MAG TPA: pyridoxamine 5'-phosphate oxidase family protein [Nitrososphaeraceae archaeon]|nr:pyridoxamine 5'-phosphate oxidase family protein [Nitrososphaeraceae archaeon]